jgi:hypothetical protein
MFQTLAGKAMVLMDIPGEGGETEISGQLCLSEDYWVEVFRDLDRAFISSETGWSHF